MTTKKMTPAQARGCINKTEMWFLNHWRFHPSVVRDGHQPPVFYTGMRKVNAIRKLAAKGIVTIEENVEWPLQIGVAKKVLLFTINRDAYREFVNARFEALQMPESMMIPESWPN
jgi:hypothetical protein